MASTLGILPELDFNYSPQDVQSILDSLTYHRPDFYGVRSAARALESGGAHCVEAALIAAMLMEQFGHVPRIMGLYGNAAPQIRDSEHAVYVFRAPTGGYCSLGKSRFPNLQARLEPQPSLDALAQSYRPGFAARGIDLEYWTLVAPDNIRQSFERQVGEMPIEYDWRSGKGDVAIVTYSLMLAKPHRLRRHPGGRVADARKL